jgi:hypothetical protein
VRRTSCVIGRSIVHRSRALHSSAYILKKLKEQF